MSAKVTFLEPEKKADADKAPAAAVVTVPKDAMATRDGKTVVFEVRDGKAKARPVTGGSERQGRVVVQGLSGGETLIAKPGDAITDGVAVKVKQSP